MTVMDPALIWSELREIVLGGNGSVFIMSCMSVSIPSLTTVMVLCSFRTPPWLFPLLSWQPGRELGEVKCAVSVQQYLQLVFIAVVITPCNGEIIMCTFVNVLKLFGTLFMPCKIPRRWWLFRTSVCKMFHIEVLIASSETHKDPGFAGVVSERLWVWFHSCFWSPQLPVWGTEFIGACLRKSLKPSIFLLNIARCSKQLWLPQLDVFLFFNESSLNLHTNLLPFSTLTYPLLFSLTSCFFLSLALFWGLGKNR